MQKQNCNALTVSQLASVLYILKSKAFSIWRMRNAIRSNTQEKAKQGSNRVRCRIQTLPAGQLVF